MARASAKPYSTVARNGEVLPPPLKWAGGKRWQLPHLRKYWERESHRRMVEPFCGGLAVTLGLKPERALLNDVNPHLFNFYCWLQRGLRITIDLKYEKAIFYRHRSRFNELLHKGTTTTREAASLFYYLNRTAYNGLCRFNSSGEFNVPCAAGSGQDFPPVSHVAWQTVSAVKKDTRAARKHKENPTLRLPDNFNRGSARQQNQRSNACLHRELFEEVAR